MEVKQWIISEARMNIGIYIYDEAEVLDFSGPFEVFSTANRFGENHWQVALIGETGKPVKGRGGFYVQPHYSIDNHPHLDLLLVVGGDHRDEVKKCNVINWIGTTAMQASLVASVCTGSFLLAEACLLDGLQVTTHWEDIEDLKQCYPQLTVLSQRRWVDSGKYTTSGGISAGIDMSLYLVAKLKGEGLARQTAKQMEYQWNQ
ncbi:DJ-1/PfpI family protein [Vibrio vulnificus]|nr:DJ-1/PfpI family protein [Vibrio vulnificus]ELY1392537.1 DJ-1/PfpI family protein [Vibrio vulnificus]RZQ17809.1 DJ-1/PfpI family protein [Vibrio vulnificus]HAS6095129.1 DJ-1/PfpI family protein [Vibrio vulnificus]